MTSKIPPHSHRLVHSTPDPYTPVPLALLAARCVCTVHNAHGTMLKALNGQSLVGPSVVHRCILPLPPTCLHSEGSSTMRFASTSSSASNQIRYRTSKVVGDEPPAAFMPERPNSWSCLLRDDQWCVVCIGRIEGGPRPLRASKRDHRRSF